MTNETKINPQDLINRFFRDEDGLVFQIKEYNKGWFRSETLDGVEQKDRLKDIEPLLLGEDFDPADEEEAATGKNQMGAQLKKYRANYTTSLASSGRKSLSNGDAVAQALEMMELEELYVAVEHIFDLDLRDKYERLNIGAQRMNLGNRIRSAYKKEDHKQHGVAVAWVNAQRERNTNAKLTHESRRDETPED